MSDLVEDMFSNDRYPGSRHFRRKPPEITERDESWRDDYTIKWVGGRKIRMYTVGSLASALQVTVPTVKDWVKNGRIPTAPYRLPSNMVVNGKANAPGRRLYLEAHIDAAIDVFERHGLMDRTKRITWKDHTDVAMDILTAWAKVALPESAEESREGDRSA